MATTDLVGPAIGFVAFASVMLCVVGWKRGWCYTEGESGAMAVASTAIGVPLNPRGANGPLKIPDSFSDKPDLSVRPE